MTQEWSIKVKLYHNEDGELEYDHDADGTQGVGDIYSLDRVNKLYESLESDDAMSEEGKQTLQEAKALNQELIGELHRILFEEGEEGEEEA